MKKSIKAGFAVLTASALSLSGMAVQSSFAAVKHAAAPVTIVWYAGTISGNGLRADVVSHFEKLYPNIKVKVVAEPTNTDTTRAQLIAQISGGATQPDVYLGDVIWPGQFGSMHLALPLNKYLPKSFFNQFAPGLVAGASYKGNVYGSPWFQDSGFLYYRKDLLAKYHLPVPKTWEKLQQEARFLLNKKAVKYGFVWQGSSYEGLTCDWMEYLTDAGGQVFNAKGQPVMDSPAALHALNFMRGLITSGVSPKAVTTFTEPNTMNLFNAGQAAFLRNWDYAYTNSQTKGQSSVIGKVGVAPLPTFAGHGTAGYATIGGWDNYINPHTKHLAQDLLFVKYLASVPGETILATKASEIPTNNAVQHNPAVRRLNPVLSIVAEQHLIARPSQSPSYAKVSQAIYTNINAALSGQTSTANALKQANSQLASAQSSSSL
ncbi:ABC transporter substrate-binding protein [Ferroacidibacillus organovorans]|uniref:Sugar ABC transporter substrate-binding protein n=1 Tax=Ferroacidibacillus organovorans TaxID=1765683 RepID=A0A853KCI3_9BACL|nr:ABC transporter substrate-binding protein [Ferroacidibacillus organovorans]KYP81502.1 sugar ABC transporter substrate-binding protein [Ferroacidibacillus organovorans]OAG94064.1 sugar ABC transporter substrate-binding protein [Ferroacidibacillus organovorans]